MQKSFRSAPAFTNSPSRSKLFTLKTSASWRKIKEVVLKYLSIDLDSYTLPRIEYLMSGREFIVKYQKLKEMDTVVKILDSLKDHQSFFSYLIVIGGYFLEQYQPAKIFEEIGRLYKQETQNSALSLSLSLSLNP